MCLNILSICIPPEYLRGMSNQFVMPSNPYGIFPPQPSVIPSDESRKAGIDASATDKEPTTPSSFQEFQFPQYSTQVGLENIIPDKDKEMSKEVGSSVRGSRRTKWTMEEEVHLAKSWVNISQDPIVGNEQKDQAFWKRIGEYYNKYRPPTMDPLRDTIQSIYSNFYNNRGSGWSDEDVLVKAHSLWKSIKTTSLSTMSICGEFSRNVRNMLHESSQSLKRRQEPLNRGYTSTSNLDMNINIDDCEVHTRQLNEKAAKRKMKSKKKKEVDEVESLVANEEFQHILRVQNTNVDGKQKIMFALTSIKGIGRRFANIVCKKADVDMNKRAGELSNAEIDSLMVIVANPRQFKIPDWFLNRKKDYKDGKFSQVTSNALDMKLRDDLERLKKIRFDFSLLGILSRLQCFFFIYLFFFCASHRNHRGLRHYWGLRVRGQHTKTTGRRGKTVGVSKKR
ncbi:hypothetical protein DH2020_024893 [Rehmannia glutinosa]|uniref:40S ribosomal protein S18 n=1 Tax=Rehmannia glutinosa TaxID=99300 RepID=A0ABR0W155_REHGL